MGVDINEGEVSIWHYRAIKHPIPDYILSECMDELNNSDDSLKKDMELPLSEVDSSTESDIISILLQDDKFIASQRRQADSGNADAQLYLANKYYDDGQYEFKRLRLNDMVHSCGFSKKEQKAYNRNNRNYQVALYWYTKALKNGKE